MSCSPGVSMNKSEEVLQEKVRLKRLDEVYEMKRLDEGDPIISEEMSMEDATEFKKSKIHEALGRFQRFVARHGIIRIILALLLPSCAVYLTIAQYTTRMMQLQKELMEKPTIQPCLAGVTKKTFPDLDYAMFGYNIIRAYPMATGRDPGLTRPVFQVDYTGKRVSADCLYRLPHGFTVVPDVSCVSSLTSKTIKDPKELTDSLSASADASGSGWDATFSASPDYKKSAKTMSSSEKFIINTEAKCDYYASQIDEMEPPKLTKSFIKMAKTLKTEQDLFRFFEYYGTHFMKEVVFGARLIYLHTLTKADYFKQKNETISVNAQASYSGEANITGFNNKTGEYNVSGTFNMDRSILDIIMRFREKAVTKTISVGAPPPTGNAADWASTVKDTPVPTRYKLVSIEELFTKRYMANTGVDYAKINKKIKIVKWKYCHHLKRKGIVDTCNPPESYVKFGGITLGAKHYGTRPVDYASCVRACTEERRCMGMTHNGAGGKMCWLYDGKHPLRVGMGKPKDIAILMITRISHMFKNFFIDNVHVAAVKRGIYETLGRKECGKKCKADSRCVAVAYPTDRNITKCYLYKKSAFKQNSITYSGKRKSFRLEFINSKTFASFRY